MSTCPEIAWPRVGIGWDVHRLATGRPLMLAGVEVPHTKGSFGHSDGDVVLHAIMDAILGAAGLDDIGQFFPDTDPAYGGIASSKLLEAVLDVVTAAGFMVVQADTIVILEHPKLSPHKGRLRQSLSELLHVPMDRVNIKGKTAEKLSDIGAGDAVACHAVVMLAPVPGAAKQGTVV